MDSAGGQELSEETKAERLMRLRLPAYIVNCLLVAGFDTLDVIAKMDVGQEPGNSIEMVENVLRESGSGYETRPTSRVQTTITTLRNRDRTDPNYHDWSKYQAKSIKLGMNQFSPLFSQKAEASMVALESTFTGWYKPFMLEVDNLIYQMGNPDEFKPPEKSV
ncbi:hypothetical protein EMCRGX_G019698 [Ephydatia muelleri]